MTTVYKVMDNTTVMCVCMTQAESDAKVAQLKKVQAKDNLLVAAGLPAVVASTKGMQERLCRIMNITSEQIDTEAGTVTQYSTVTESI